MCGHNLQSRCSRENQILYIYDLILNKHVEKFVSDIVDTFLTAFLLKNGKFVSKAPSMSYIFLFDPIIL